MDFAEQQTDAFLAAVREDHADDAARLASASPDLAARTVHTAAAAGDFEAVAAFLATDSSLATAGHGHEQWQPLAYACRSHAHIGNPARADALRRIAVLLLDAGADVHHASVWHEGDRPVPIPALYHACMSDHVAMVELLLARGARTNDGESIYHAAQFDREACLAVLLAHGADLSSRQAPYGNTPLYFLAGHESDGGGTAAWFRGLEWLLAHGADPNVTSYAHREAPLHQAARNPNRLAAARALVAHGADVNQPRVDGVTPLQIAVRHGNTGVADLLRTHGAQNGALTPLDRFLGACLAANETEARALLAAHPDLLAHPEARGALVQAARADRPAAVQLMTRLGFDVAAEGRETGTPLHWAAWLGRVEMVRTLLALGAPVNTRDRQYGSSPLGWAAHGSTNVADARTHAAIIDLLADAGATLDAATNRGNQEPLAFASPDVAARLRARGLTRAGALSSD